MAVIGVRVPARLYYPAYGRVDVILSYDTDDPFAVQLIFLTAQGEPDTTWTFARELLRRGQARVTGSGDVVVKPHGDDLDIFLRPPTGKANLLIPRQDVSAFIAQTYVMCDDTEASFRCHAELDSLALGL